MVRKAPRAPAKAAVKASDRRQATGLPATRKTPATVRQVAPRSKAAIARQAEWVAEHLASDFPDVDCALENETPFQLLVATILSAQCTDARVNMVTPELFRRWPDAAAMAVAPIKDLEKVIQSTGFYRNKAKNIRAASAALVESHGGEVPQEMESLVSLPGVGRKTANVVLGTAYGQATGVVVDTHVTRICRRLGLTKHTDAVKIEQDLMVLLPQQEWVPFAHRMIYHGRQICIARKPKCTECSMRSFCPKVGVTSST